jgi:hypothetical protein
MDQIDHMHPLTNISKANCIEDDFSQDSLDAVDWDRLDLIKVKYYERTAQASQLTFQQPLRDTVIDSLCCVLKNYLETMSETKLDSAIMYRFVDCWARLVSFVTENEVMVSSIRSFMAQSHPKC